MNQRLRQIGLAHLSEFNDCLREWSCSELEESWKMALESREPARAQAEALAFSLLPAQFFYRFAGLTGGFIPDNLLENAPASSGLEKEEGRRYLKLPERPPSSFFPLSPHEENGMPMPEAQDDFRQKESNQKISSLANRTRNNAFPIAGFRSIPSPEKPDSPALPQDKAEAASQPVPTANKKQNTEFTTLGSLNDLADTLQSEEKGTTQENSAAAEKKRAKQEPDAPRSEFTALGNLNGLAGVLRQKESRGAWEGFTATKEKRARPGYDTSRRERPPAIDAIQSSHSSPKKEMGQKYEKGGLEGADAASSPEDAFNNLLEELKAHINREYQRFYGD